MSIVCMLIRKFPMYGICLKFAWISVTSRAQEQRFLKQNMYVRRATHSGSWYTDNSNALHSQLQGDSLRKITSKSAASLRNWRAFVARKGWLEDAVSEAQGRVRAIIAPHAGYR